MSTWSGVYYVDAGDEKGVGIDYKELPQDVAPGDTLLLNDGAIELEVKQVSGSQNY